MVVFSRIQYFLSFIVSAIAFGPRYSRRICGPTSLLCCLYQIRSTLLEQLPENGSVASSFIFAIAPHRQLRLVGERSQEV